MKHILKPCLIILILSFLTSCTILNPEKMLRTGKNHKFSEFPSVHNLEYKLAPFDELSFSVYANNGERLISSGSMGNVSNGMGGVSGVSGMTQNNASSTGVGTIGSGGAYIIEFDGYIKLPMFGRVMISGMTLREAEKFLEDKYSLFFNKPYVQLKVTNMRVYIFPGGTGGTARVLNLTHPNTTLFEAIAMVGGIAEGRANRIKLIRGDLKNPEIYLIDLSTIDGMKKADLFLQANDIIYIEPTNKVPTQIIGIITPYLTLLTTFLLIYTLLKK
ncbi:MAG: polysaccharide biosynthesis/export family protein [Bacteroidota bacterium]|nr:polysaccharide biosynthesis/export family protein [Bacteroidota bacterium]